ncbi:MAG TPA: hypothetical protein VNT60_06770 [Deinococcales bacterium]|nr:hypothetical protein [Deinococcales bacterium]
MRYLRPLLVLIALAVPALASLASAQKVELLVFAPSLNRLVAHGVLEGAELKLTVNSYSGKVTGMLITTSAIPLSGTLEGGRLLLVGPRGGNPQDVASLLASYGINVRVSITRVNSQDAVSSTPAKPAAPPAAAPAAAPAAPAQSNKEDKGSNKDKADKDLLPELPKVDVPKVNENKDDGGKGALPDPAKVVPAAPGKGKTK